MSLMCRLLASSMLSLIVLVGCRSAQKPPAPSSVTDQNKIYHLRGKVVSTEIATGEVTLDHEAIPGFMEAMTMPYKLKDAHQLGGLHPGDVITADVLVSPDPNAELLLDHLVVVAQARPDRQP